MDKGSWDSYFTNKSEGIFSIVPDKSLSQIKTVSVSNDMCFNLKTLDKSDVIIVIKIIVSLLQNCQVLTQKLIKTF